MTILGTDVFGKQAGVTSAARTPGLGRWSLANLPTPVPPKHLPQIQSNVLPGSLSRQEDLLLLLQSSFYHGPMADPLSVR